MSDNLHYGRFMSGGAEQWIPALEKEIRRIETQLDDPANAENTSELLQTLADTQAELRRARRDSDHSLYLS